MHVYVCVCVGLPGEPGLDGSQGPPGLPGADGKDGAPGIDGKSLMWGIAIFFSTQPINE